MNNTGKSEKIRKDETIGVRTGHYWKTVKDGQEADIPEHYGMALGFTKVVNDNDKEEQSIDIVDNINKALNPKDDIKAYKDKLMSIKGIGKKTAKDIMKDYPTEADMVKRIKEEPDMPYDDDVAESLKNVFSE